MKESNLTLWGNKAQSLFSEVRNYFQNSKNDDLRVLLKDVPTSFIDSSKTLNIVFAGQYSAGKSTILSLLTGQKLETGGGITTMRSQEISWNGVKVIDTPGIHTQNRPDHDEITYQAIAKADLLVFVITQKGFDSHVGQHFRELLMDKGKGHEMMLVVNKMEDAENGNTPDQQEILLNDIRKVIAPQYTPEDLYTTFIDAKSYQESLLETDPKEKLYLEQISGFEQLNVNLNRFMHDKQLLGKCTTSLYTLQQLLRGILNDYKTGDNTIDETRKLLSEQRYIVSQSASRLRRNLKSLVEDKACQVSVWGRGLADQLRTADDQISVHEEFNQRLKDTSVLSSQIQEDINHEIQEENSCIQREYDRLKNSEFGRMVIDDIANLVHLQDVKPSMMGRLLKGGKTAQKLGSLIVKWSTSPTGGNILLSGIKVSSNTQMHKMVLTVGHSALFNKKFMPWEAVRIANKIGKIGAVVNVAGAVVDVAFQVYQDKQEEKISKQLSEERSSIRDTFNSASKEIQMHYNEATDSWVAETYGSELDRLDSQIKEVDDLVHNKNKDLERVRLYLEQDNDLIKEIQSSNVIA